VLSFLLLTTTSGQPLPADAVARCTGLPSRSLTFVPSRSTTWRSDGGHVVLVAWADAPGLWHMGGHGCTVTTTAPWPLASRFSAPSGIAFELTDRLGDAQDATGALGWLTGSAALARVRPDGGGFVGAPTTGGGAVYVAHGDGIIAVSDRAAIASLGAGGGARRSDLPGLVRGAVLDEESAFAGVQRLRPGSYLALRGRTGGTIVDGPVPWLDGALVDVTEAIARASDDVVRLVALASQHAGPRVLELGADPGSLVLAAAVAASGTSGRFTLRARPGETDRRAVDALAQQLDMTPVASIAFDPGGEALDARVRASVGRLEGLIAPTALLGGPLGGIRDGTGLVLSATPGGVLSPDVGPTGRRILTSQAWAAVEQSDASWREGRGRGAASDEAARLLAEVDRRAPRRQRAACDLAGPIDLLDPIAITSVIQLALAASVTDQDATALLVDALHPPMLRARTSGGEEPVSPSDESWRWLAPVLEAHVLGHGRELLQDVLDLDEVAMVVRAGTVPDPDTRRSLEGALALAVWAASTETHRPARADTIVLRRDVATPHQAPTLVTGVTSRSLIELAKLSVPLDAVEHDALLGIAIDGEVRDLVHQILLAAGATPGQLPEDLDERLSGPATSHLAGPARTLLARRGGTLSDPRLALTLAFWQVHVAPPRVVLVAERPPDLAERSAAQLPVRDLLGWWVDAMTCAAASGADIRIVDPGDLLELDENEATGWDGLDEGRTDGDLVRVVRTVDSLVREVELAAARPLLRTIRLARAVNQPTESARALAPAAAPLHVVDELWERAVEADRRLGESRASEADLEARLVALAAELDQLRSRRGFKAAWATLRGADD
jgi:hypothetical protein